MDRGIYVSIIAIDGMGNLALDGPLSPVQYINPSALTCFPTCLSELTGHCPVLFWCHVLAQT